MSRTLIDVNELERETNLRLITVDGETHSLRQWARLVNRNPSTLSYHIQHGDIIEWLRRQPHERTNH